MSKNVACPTADAESTVFHFFVSVERRTATDTSGFDHVTKIDPQPWGTTDTPRAVQTPGQASQTLENALRYEWPPESGCARQACALRVIAHVVMPLGVVRQHVT